MLIRKLFVLWQAHKDRIISRQAAIALRAEYENMMALNGDPVGIYGRYDPVTMPATKPSILPGYSFDDYDDGLKEWK